MIDLNRIIGGLSQSGAAAGLAGGLAGGTVGGALATKKGRKTAKKAAQIGGLALVGGLAWKAYHDYRRSSAERVTDVASRRPPAWTPATATGPQAPGTAAAIAAAERWQRLSRQDFEAVAAEPAEGESRALLIVRGMIAAAMADGHLDAGEQGRLFRQIDRLDLTTEEKGMLLDELRHPWSIEALAARCGEPETAIELYAAALLAIDETRPESALWLEELARRLALPPALVAGVHIQADSEKATRLAEPA
jgi:uncharacterized membrane protein YebE (DUF533 family)